MLNIISENINNDLIRALSNTVLHSVWQFFLIGFLLFLIFKFNPRLSSKKKYVISFSALILVLVVFLITFLVQSDIKTVSTTVTVINTGQTTGNSISNFHEANNQTYGRIHDFVFLFWITGLAVFFFRMLLSASYLHYISRKSQVISNGSLENVMSDLLNKMKISPGIRIGESDYINTPIITGIIKPVILFPIGLINHLNPDETQAIIAHELAHFIRKDIIYNYVLSLVETIFYYHPAIWWISSIAKAERENCCDDMAITYTGNRIQYARTLIKLQDYNGSPAYSLALKFNNSSLFSNRIKRILEMTHNRNYLNGKLLTITLLMVSIVLFSKHLIGNSDNSGKEITFPKEINSIISHNITADSLPIMQKESITIQQKTNDKDIKISMENGEIKELVIDGKTIEEKDYDKYQDIIQDIKPSGKGNGKSFYFDLNDGSEGMGFNWEQMPDMDSLMKSFGFQNFNFNYNGQNKERLNENLKKLNEQMKEFNLKFDFHSPEGMDFDFEKFDMPDMENFLKDFKMEGFDFQFSPDHFDMEAPEGEMLEWDDRGSTVNEVLGDALNRDGFLIPNKENKIELTGKYLKINGQKQPENIWHKYKRIVEDVYGTELNKKSRLEFTITGKEPKRKYKMF
ncbi:MAG: M56 family metallopeptidase [Saprospiraceae bacterium]|nr:M56 family metallopeptidase [Saprospiraceae bacterium]